MNLYLHELIHLSLSLFAGLIIWKKWHKHIGVFIAALLGGFFIDFDHLFDYFLAFGTRLNLSYFLKGYQFLKSSAMYVPLHSWELVLMLVFFVVFAYKYFGLKTIQLLLLSFSLALFLHLIIDTTTNHVTIQGYSILYRMSHDFRLKDSITADHYQKYLEQKNKITIHP